MSWCNTTFDLKMNIGHSDLYFMVQWFLSFNFCSEKHFRFIGKARFRRAMLSCNSSYLYSLMQWNRHKINIVPYGGKFLCPQLRRSCGSILVSGCPSVRACVRPSIKKRAQGFEISHMDSSWKNSWCTFFLSELSPFLELCPFEKIRTKSDACHILWTVYARVLKFHVWIPHGKIADPYFFLVRVISLSGVMPLWKI